MIVFETLAERWWALAFVPVYFWVAREERSWRSAVRFLLIAFAVSLAAELSSTRNGFPYGDYEYVAHTRGEELYVSNVPLFVPLTFGVVVWAGRALARRAGFTSLAGLALAGGLAAAALDLVIDPVTLRGGSWFLGRLYRFEAGGIWFGVPWSNAAGWFLVSAAVIGIDFWMGKPGRGFGIRSGFSRGELLAAGTAASFVVLAIAIGRPDIAAAGAGVAAVLIGGARALGRIR